MLARRVTALLAALTLVMGGASLAYGALTPQSPQAVQLDRTCSATLMTITQVMNRAASAQPRTIVSHLDVVTPGVLNARMVFDRSGSSIRVAADRAHVTRTHSSASLACAQTVGHLRGLGPGRSRTVATLTMRFTKPGRYTLTFALNPVGRMLLAQLGAAQRAYRAGHPHGHELPGMAYGVGLAYNSPG